jgi:hypothetical protein
MDLKHLAKPRLVLKSLLFGSITITVLTSCCSKPPSSDPNDVIVVEKSEIVEHPDGSFTVNKAWMLKRLETEKKLADALKQCLGEEE